MVKPLVPRWRVKTKTFAKHDGTHTGSAYTYRISSHPSSPSEKEEQRP